MSEAKHRRRRNQIHQPGLTFARPAKPPVVREGIRRQAGRAKAPERPLTEVHLAVLGQLTEQPVKAGAIARELGIASSMVQSAVYVLQARGLAQRIPHVGWTRSA